MRPFLRRAASTRRPAGVAIRARKPETRIFFRRVPSNVQPMDFLPLACTTNDDRCAGLLRWATERDIPVRDAVRVAGRSKRGSLQVACARHSSAFVVRPLACHSGEPHAHAVWSTSDACHTCERRAQACGDASVAHKGRLQGHGPHGLGRSHGKRPARGCKRHNPHDEMIHLHVLSHVQRCVGMQVLE